jgi:hypothetical protein
MPQAETVAGAAPLTMQELSATLPRSELIHTTERLIVPPPHDALHGLQGPTIKARVSQGHTLHGSEAVCCSKPAARHCASPPVAGAPPIKHATERLRRPPPHGALHRLHPVAFQYGPSQLLLHDSIVTGLLAAGQSAGPTGVFPSATHATARVRTPAPQVVLHGPQSLRSVQPYCGQGTLLHTCPVAGAGPAPAAVHA